MAQARNENPDKAQGAQQNRGEAELQELSSVTLWQASAVVGLLMFSWIVTYILAHCWQPFNTPWHGYAILATVAITLVIMIVPLIIWRRADHRGRPFGVLARAGRNIWHLDSLWFVVLVLGLLLVASDFGHKTLRADKPFQPDDAEVLLGMGKEIVIAVFLAALTSVVVHNIAGIQRQAGCLIGAAETLTTGTDSVSQDVKNVKGVIGEVKGMLASIKHNTDNMRNLTCLREAAMASGKKAWEDAVGELEAARNRFDSSHLLPILPPHEPGTEAVTFEKLKAHVTANPESVSRCAIMTAVTASCMNSLARFRGIVRQPTDYAFGAKTVCRIVEHLNDWWPNYEMHTLMPKTPAMTFQFANGMDINDWLSLFQMFHNYQNDPKGGQGTGKWHRHFATRAGEERGTIISFRDKRDEYACSWFLPTAALVEELRHCVLLSEPNGCLPKTIKDTAWLEVEQWLRAICSNDPDKATQVMVEDDDLLEFTVVGWAENADAKKACNDCKATFPLHGFLPLRDVVTGLHVNGSALHREFEDAQIQDWFGSPTKPPRSTFEFFGEGARPTKVHLASDMFAVCRVAGTEKVWQLLFCFHELDGSAVPGIRPALATILDLDVLGTDTRNAESVRRVRQVLDEIFNASMPYATFIANKRIVV